MSLATPVGIAAAAASTATDFDRRLRPRGWELSGGAAAKYELTADRATSTQGSTSAALRAIAPADGGDFALVIQRVKASPFRGRRVRFSAAVRTQSAGAATIAIAASDVNGSQITPKFMLVDASRRMPLGGTTSWTRLEAVVDIPEAAEILTYGGVLAGPGAAWFDSAQLEVVGNATSTTQPPLRSDPYVESNAGMASALDSPTNLDFEEVDEVR